MGMYCEITAASSPDDVSELLEAGDAFGFDSDADTATASGVSLEKAWHGLHYLLTGDPWGGEGPLAFLLIGGEHLDGDEEEPRWLTAEETAAVHQALAAVTDEGLWSRFNAARMEELEIYPGIWDEPEADLHEEYVGYFQDLRRLVATAVQHNQGLLISLC